MLRLLQYAQNCKIRDEAAPLRRTKVICTVGPKNASEELLERLVDSGMDMMRLNFSHGSHEWFEEMVSKLRRILAHKGTAVCAIALDTKGPEIRTGTMKNGVDSVSVEAGSTVEVTTDPAYKSQCTATHIYVDYEDLCETVTPGMTIFIDDGLLDLEVIEVIPQERRVVCIARNTAELSDHKGVNLPGAKITLPAVSEKDRSDLEFGARMGVDFVFASFIRNAEQVHEVRDALKGWPARIIAKIENEEGLNNIDEIIEVADGVMVARGDMGIEIPASEVFAAQKMIISKCNARGKPVICATQMLESMIVNPRPTRAEVTDVGTAILDGADCVMLSGETAKGKYPIEAVSTMCRVCVQAESLIDARKVFQNVKEESDGDMGLNEGVAAACVEMCLDLKAPAIIVIATSGNTARFLAKYRPPVPVLVICFQESVARQLLIHRALFPLVIDIESNPALYDDVPALIAEGLFTLRELKVVQPGDSVVTLHSEHVVARPAPEHHVFTKRFAGSSANLHAMNSHDNLHRPPSHSNLRNVMSSGELNKRSNPQSGRGSIDEHPHDDSTVPQPLHVPVSHIHAASARTKSASLVRIRSLNENEMPVEGGSDSDSTAFDPHHLTGDAAPLHPKALPAHGSLPNIAGRHLASVPSRGAEIFRTMQIVLRVAIVP